MTLIRPPGLHRDRAGGHLVWAYDSGEAVTDPDELARLHALAVPPAWREVWGSPDPHAPVQATGLDARGRTQYRYLPAVTRAHAQDKFAHLAAFGAALPDLRRQVAADLFPAPGTPVPRRTVLAAMTRLLDLGFFRVGTSRYTRDNHTYGLSTLRRDQVAVSADTVHFDYVAKEHLHRITEVTDPAGARVVQGLLDTPGPAGDPLFQGADDRRAPSPIGSAAVNAYIHAIAAVPASAKAFRTWSGTVVAAASLGGAVLPGLTPSARTTPATLAVRTAALLLGNTPAVARASYVHPSVLAGVPDPEVIRAVKAFAERAGHRDLRQVWTDSAVQAAVAARLAGWRAA